MKILLIEPAKAPVSIGGEDFFVYEPLALEYLAAALVRDHDVEILDLRLDKDLAGALERFRPDVVGVTAYTVHVNGVRRLLGEIKSWNPGIVTVVGGHHATILPADFNSPAVDAVVMGEGVLAFKELVERIENGRGLAGIPGTVVRQEGQTVRTEAVPLTDLDTLPFPARHLTARYRKYYFSEWMKPLASMRTSKGCPYRCNFCALWKIAEKKYYKREPRKIVEELSGIAEPNVFFADDESLVDITRMKSLARLIIESGLQKTFFLYGRSDTIARNPELLELWRRAGLQRVFIGLEFFRDDDLAYIHKGSTVADNLAAVRILQDLDLDIYASFIVRPDFTHGDFRAFRRHVRGLGLSFASFSVLTPLPGTDFHARVRDRMLTHDYDYFDFIHTLLPTRLPLKRFYEEYSRLYSRSVPLAGAISTLRKFPLRELPAVLRLTRHWYQRLKTVHLDYDSVHGRRGPAIPAA